MKESLRYLQNAREILKKAPREGHIYTDVKFVQEACGTAYLAVLKAIDGYLLDKGLPQKQLPKSYEEYQKALRKYVAIHNGRLFKEFSALYETLHIAGYYRGLLRLVEVVRDTMKASQEFITKISK
ncbi:MAG: DUF5618 family protein [Planctomycetota bacterium]|nr:DUF5618 family protein [Planctomycetota bacterium]